MLEHTAKSPEPPGAVTVVQTDTGLGRALADHLEGTGATVQRLDAATLVVLSPEEATDRLADALAKAPSAVLAADLPLQAPHRIDGYLANLLVATALVRAVERAGARQVVCLSSEAVYPPEADHVNESSCAGANDLTGGMHRAREVALQSLHRLPVAVLRLAQVYGCPDTDRPGPDRMIRALAAGQEIRLPGGGEDRRDYVLADDVFRIVGEVLANGSRGVLNVATGHSVDQATVARKVAAAMRRPAQIQSTPRVAPVTHRDFDITAVFKAFPKLAFQPLDQGLGRLAARLDPSPSIEA